MSHPDFKNQNQAPGSLEDAINQAKQQANAKPNPFGSGFGQTQGQPEHDATAVNGDAIPTNIADGLAALDQTSVITDLQEKVATLENDLMNARAQGSADLYNLQKRVEREAESTRKFALEKFAGSLLEIVDNLERAIDASAENNPVTEGVQLTLKSLLTTLDRFGVHVVNPMAQPFDAELHQAVGVIPNTPANEVGQVLQKGYTLNGRLLRPAMVLVGQ